uniref:Uncharacterized protein n=1 Tax=viral metagenome TaxID=1070528 RepID=A0A6H1ZVY5_9ZZZZ
MNDKEQPPTYVLRLTAEEIAAVALALLYYCALLNRWPKPSADNIETRVQVLDMLIATLQAVLEKET